MFILAIHQYCNTFFQKFHTQFYFFREIMLNVEELDFLTTETVESSKWAAGKMDAMIIIE